jgi:hypothetical protein
MHLTPSIYYPWFSEVFLTFFRSTFRILTIDWNIEFRKKIFKKLFVCFCNRRRRPTGSGRWRTRCPRSHQISEKSGLRRIAGSRDFIWLDIAARERWTIKYAESCFCRCAYSSSQKCIFMLETIKRSSEEWSDSLLAFFKLNMYTHPTFRYLPILHGNRTRYVVAHEQF